MLCTIITHKSCFYNAVEVIIQNISIKKVGKVATHPHTPEDYTAIDQLHAQVDKKGKKKKGENTIHP